MWGTLFWFCQRLMGSEGSKGRAAVAHLARIEGERDFTDPSLSRDPDTAVMEFASIVHDRLGVPQEGFCYSNLNLPEFRPVREAVDFYFREREAGGWHAFNNL